MMNKNKKNLTNRNKQNEPSSYLCQFVDDDELPIDASREFSDSGSEWEASQSEIARYIADGGSNIHNNQTVNTSEYSASVSIPGAMVTEYSNGDIRIETSVDDLSVLAHDNDAYISNNETTVSEDANIIKHGKHFK